MNALTHTWRHVHVTGSESPLAYNARARESSRASLLFREDRFSTNFPSLRTFPKKKKEQTIKLIRRPILNLIVDSIAFLFHKLRLWKFVENTKMKQGFVKMENFDRIFFFLIRNRKIHHPRNFETSRIVRELSKLISLNVQIDIFFFLF